MTAYERQELRRAADTILRLIKPEPSLKSSKAGQRFLKLCEELSTSPVSIQSISRHRTVVDKRQTIVKTMRAEGYKVSEICCLVNRGRDSVDYLIHTRPSQNEKEH